MAKTTDSAWDHLAGDSDGWLGGILADEDRFDRRALWRLGAWGLCAIAAVTVGVWSSQLPASAQRSDLAAAGLAMKAQRAEQIAQTGQAEASRLSAAVETLNTDRDRLFVRLSALEQSMDSVTGSIRKSESPAPVWPDLASMAILALPPFAVAVPATQSPPASDATPSSASIEADKPSSEIAMVSTPSPAEPAAPALADEPPPALAKQLSAPPSALAAIQSVPIPDAVPATTGALPDAAAGNAADDAIVAAAEFGLDLGAAGSLDGLRTLWRATNKAHKTELERLRPIVVVRERRNGRAPQLHLVAGPIKDAAVAARLCAALIDAQRSCQTAAFDGQRLSLASENPNPPPTVRRRKPPQPKQPAG